MLGKELTEVQGADLGHIICDPKAGAVCVYPRVYCIYAEALQQHQDLLTRHHRSSRPRAWKVGLRSSLYSGCRSSASHRENNYREELTGLLERLHVLVIGPGLGRDKYMQEAAKTAIAIARQNDMYLVIDADGLWLVQNEPDVVKGYRRAVLTPNVVEFGRLCDKVVRALFSSCEASGRSDVQGIDQKGDKDTLARDLARKLGNVTIMQKGPTDIITNGEEVLKCDEEGGLKRCGGQGDILSGQIGTMLGWAKLYEEGVSKCAALSPCCVELTRGEGTLPSRMTDCRCSRPMAARP